MLTTTNNSTTTSRTLTSKQLPKATPWVVAVASIIVAIIISFIAFGGFNIPVVAVLAGLINVVGVFAISASYEGRRKATDRVATTVVTSSFILACVPLISLLWMTISKGGAAISFDLLSRTMLGMKGVLDQQYVAGEATIAGGFYHAIVGTVLITAMACIISIPIGVLTAIYLVEYAEKNRLGKAITFLVDVMTGIPSIVAGLFAFALFSTIAGFIMPDAAGIAKTGFTAAVALSVLMIPIVVRNTEEILRLVPMDLREASYALGVPKWKTIVKIVLPTSVSGILSGITIAIARVIGETAPIMVTAGFAKALNWNLFSGWMSTLPTFIYDSQLRPVSPGDAAMASSERAWAAALVLVALVMLLNLLARLIAKVLAPKAGR
ncbi:MULTISPECIES: phosphate ABC transporter permease PstA [Brevibacterium]|uniref:phosphate ABC transporter permease PstA n=1 Tax=Brevibacterium TaxID=1696 RepID=UPI000F64A478|nr:MULTISPECIES: phosphate ABC transporter permease PstA [Brevibacterium]AZL10542.1 phosphate ABC transporter, permease protein PstA [Brevibacterium aurantiacum]MCF2586911.1 phosphate ABC transporter permease PstA [Brevibacterium sp. UCMA 11752]